MRPTKLIVNLDNLKHNIRKIKNKIGSNVEIMAVLKANAYGNGDKKLIAAFKEEGINNFAVAIANEGKRLKGIDKDINVLILNQPNICEVDTIVDNDLKCSACDIDFLKTLNKKSANSNKITKVHIEIDTGAGRNGILPEQIDEFFDNILNLKNIEIEGIFTHFTCVDSSKEYTDSQFEKMKNAKEKIEKICSTLKFCHGANSSTIMGREQNIFNMARPGIALYGYYPDDKYSDEIELKPIEKLVSKINFIKTVPEGYGISYDKTFVTERKTKIAVVPIGYADGYKRVFSNRAKVVVNGKLANVIGKVCMDMIMVDVTDIEEVSVNDDVYLFDNELVKVEDLAKLADTINYEIISSISDRVERVYEG